MGWYTRSSRFIFDALGRHHFKINSAFRSSNSRISNVLITNTNRNSPFLVESQNPHLNEFEWEFVVVDESASVYAIGLPGEKIVIHSSMLSRDKEDDEVAASIAREVGHAVARHHVEEASDLFHFKRRSLLISMWILSLFYDDTKAKRMSLLPDRRRMELEADYIGLILMAYAGYDPRVAPRLDEEIGGRSAWDDYLESHPCGKTRAQLLSKPQVMEEALSIYREVRAGRGLEA